MKKDAGNKKKLETVARQLANDRTKGEKRLELLRTQAQLGDERDAAEKAARRAASDRP